MISIHQSQFLPWLPYFYKILKSDIFIILDDVQFQKNGTQNRNMIKTPRGVLWLTVPIKHKFGTPINEVKIADKNVYQKILKTLRFNYAQSEFFPEVYPVLEDVFNCKPEGLHELNSKLINKSLGLMGNESKIFMSSSFNTKKKKDELVVEIIKHFGETEYLSGKGALSYMDLKKFKKAGIKVYLYDFKYREYEQLWNKQVGFLPDLSIVDLLFNLKDTEKYIMDCGSLYSVGY